MTDGTGETTEDGDEVGARVALAAGLAVRDGCGELIVGLGRLGVAVGTEVAGVGVAGVVGEVAAGALAGTVTGLTQKKTTRVTRKMPMTAQVEVRIRRISQSPPARPG